MREILRNLPEHTRKFNNQKTITVKVPENEKGEVDK